MLPDLAILGSYAAPLAAGTGVTLALTAGGGALGLAVGLGLALGRRHLALRVLEGVFVGLPLLLILVFLYFGLGQLGVDLPPALAGVIGLGLHAAPYQAAAIRAGLAAVPAAQRETAAALGLSPRRALRLVVLPQALRAMRGPVGGNLVAMLKDSALVSVIGVGDLVQAAQRGIAETFQPFQFYLAVAAIYYALSLLTEALLRRWAGPAVPAGRTSPA